MSTAVLKWCRTELRYHLSQQNKEVAARSERYENVGLLCLMLVIFRMLKNFSNIERDLTVLKMQ